MMHQPQSITLNIFQSLLSDILQLTKFRLAISVVFSSIAGYFLAIDNLNLTSLTLLFVGGFLWWLHQMFLINGLKKKRMD